MTNSLQGKKGLVVGIANDQSIAWGCARALRDAGVELALTWFNDKARPHVEPLAQKLQAAITLPLDVEQPGQMEAVFDAIAQRWGQLDFVLHSIAFAPKSDLHGRVADSSREGFARAMDISCHSFARMAHLAEPLMPRGGSLMTMSYVGAEEVIPGYGLMGPVKAALLGSRTGPQGHPCQCHLARPAGHARGLGHPRFRYAVARGCAARTAAPSGGH